MCSEVNTTGVEKKLSEKGAADLGGSLSFGVTDVDKKTEENAKMMLKLQRLAMRKKEQRVGKGLRRIKQVWLVLVLSAVVVVIEILGPDWVEKFIPRGKLFLVPMAAFSICGVVLVWKTLKQNIKGRLKWFLLLAGGSGSAFFVSVVLHNLVYALMIGLMGQDFWENAGVPDEPVFFLIALILCPLLLVIGVLGSGWYLFIKKGDGLENG